METETTRTNSNSPSRRDFLTGLFGAVAAITSGAHEQIANATEFKDFMEVKGREHSITIHHNDLNIAHRLAYQHFTEGIGKRIRSGSFTLSNFRVEINKEGSSYSVCYKIDLNPAKSGERHTHVELYGKILSGKTAEEAETNAKKLLQEEMGRRDSQGRDMRKRWADFIHQEIGPEARFWEESENGQVLLKERDLYWYHAAILLKGN